MRDQEGYRWQLPISRDGVLLDGFRMSATHNQERDLATLALLERAQALVQVLLLNC